jgi:hypothetical protein
MKNTKTTKTTKTPTDGEARAAELAERRATIRAAQKTARLERLARTKRNIELRDAAELAYGAGFHRSLAKLPPVEVIALCARCHAENVPTSNAASA